MEKSNMPGSSSGTATASPTRAARSVGGRSSPPGLKGRVAWVTGASRGLGRAIALGMAEAGASVALTARTEEELEEVADRARESGSEALVVPGSVGDLDDVRRSAGDIVEKFGRLDVLVNVAGINPVVQDSAHLPLDAWHRVMGVNLTGTFQCCQAAARHMLEADGGSIINVSSVHGSTGVARMAAYAASKGGVEALTKALAVEWAENDIRVNCLAPGYFRTSLTESYLDGPRGESVVRRTPMARVGRPDELVGAAVYLASGAASYVTGTVLTVDGGWKAL